MHTTLSRFLVAPALPSAASELVSTLVSPPPHLILRELGR